MPARAQRRRMKCIYGGGIRCRKAEVQTRAFVGLNGALRLRNPKRNGLSSIPVADQRSRGPQAFISERLQHGVVEAFTSIDLPYPDRDVSNHGSLPLVLRGLSCDLPKAKAQTKASARSVIEGTIRSGWCGVMPKGRRRRLMKAVRIPTDLAPMLSKA